ncbi:MAG: SRPBCC family protein [Chloroflexi bacterium]|nr:SRPBCC family protein [Chloroflexota bacterium]
MLHRITHKQTIPAPLDEVWTYFATPHNLNEMTPPDMNFETIHGGDEKMFQGQLIEYRVSFMPLTKSRWLTEIAHVEEKTYFVDAQRIGPYRFWYHEHRFQAVEAGTQITDQVTYELPFGILGDIIHTIWVKHKLNRIFEFRKKKVAELFGS